MKKYRLFFIKKWYISCLIIGLFTLAGCLKGAAIESHITVGVVPLSEGRIRLAGEQNMFICYKMAILCGLGGMIFNFLFIYVYMLIYEKIKCKILKLFPDMKKNNLFINMN